MDETLVLTQNFSCLLYLIWILHDLLKCWFSWAILSKTLSCDVKQWAFFFFSLLPHLTETFKFIISDFPSNMVIIYHNIVLIWQFKKCFLQVWLSTFQFHLHLLTHSNTELLFCFLCFYLWVSLGFHWSLSGVQTLGVKTGRVCCWKAFWIPVCYNAVLTCHPYLFNR